VAKYDAFGREIGEDTLSGLGGRSVAEPVPDAGASRQEPAEVTAAPPETAPPPPAPPSRPPGQPLWPRRRPRPTRRMWRLAGVLVLIGFGIQAGVESGIDGAGERDTVVTPLQPVPLGEEPSDPAASRSLLTTRRFGAAMDKLRASGRGRLFTLRLAGDRIDAQVETADGKIRVVQVLPSLEVRTLTTVAGGFGVSTFSFEAVRAAAPQRLIRAAARRLEQPATRVNYLSLTPIGEELQWAVYFRNGRHAVGDAHGRIERVF
jgi:hypothetical protein